MNDKILITKSKQKELQEELTNLIEVERKKVIQQLQQAREEGDLSENADYDAAKDKQFEIERRISEIQAILENCEIISDVSSTKDIVSLNSYVKILDMDDNEEYTYQIVSSIEANPDENKISNEAPLAKFLLGRKVNDVVEVKGIEHYYKVKILKISTTKL